MGYGIAESWLEAIKSAGAHKAQICLTETERAGFAVENRRIFIARNSIDQSAELTAITDTGYAARTINAPSEQDKTAIARQLIESAGATASDPAYDIAPMQPREKFDNGVLQPDRKLIHDRLDEFLAACERYPELTLRRMTRLDFLTEKKTFLNSNGVAFSSRVGYYEFYLIFSSRKGLKNSLGYFITLRGRDLSMPLMKWGLVETLIRQSVESVDAVPVSGKFTGDIVVAPECLGTFLEYIVENSLRDNALIPGTSSYKDKLGERVSSPGFSLSSKPTSPEIASGYFITPDGYKAENLPLIEDGYLKTFLLSQYGSRKTGLPRASNSGGCYMVEPGGTDMEDLVSSVKKGLLVTRFSCGQPSQNGDFSGVVKNSYYIENGRIRFPVSETMISGNLQQMLLRINGISMERVNLGNAVYPWISFGGISVSGK